MTEHAYFPQTVHVPRDLAYYGMVTAKRKELGFNFVRFHTYVPLAEYLEAADELGMLVHVESNELTGIRPPLSSPAQERRLAARQCPARSSAFSGKATLTPFASIA